MREEALTLVGALAHENVRTCRVEMVRHGQGECNKEVLCTTVEQESVRPGTDIQNLFS